MNQHSTSDQAVLEEIAPGQATTGMQWDALGWPTTNGELAHGERILWVEDEAFVREVVGEILGAAGYTVLVANNAPEAQRTYEQHGGAVDLLLTDVVLAGENGRALAKRLKGEQPGLKVLLVTGYAEQMARCGAGIDREEFLAKPFSCEALLRRVKLVLEGGNHEANRER